MTLSCESYTINYNYAANNLAIGGVLILNPTILDQVNCELVQYLIDKQRAELTRLVERHGYNFQHRDVLAASIEMDRWLNLYQHNCTNKQGSRKE
jgi:hypothetical protein